MTATKHVVHWDEVEKRADGRDICRPDLPGRGGGPWRSAAADRSPRRDADTPSTSMARRGDLLRAGGSAFSTRRGGLRGRPRDCIVHLPDRPHTCAGAKGLDVLVFGTRVRWKSACCRGRDGLGGPDGGERPRADESLGEGRRERSPGVPAAGPRPANVVNLNTVPVEIMNVPGAAPGGARWGAPRVGPDRAQPRGPGGG